MATFKIKVWLYEAKEKCSPTFEPRKKPSYFPLYWMVNRDPYNGLFQSLYNWVV